MGQADPRVAFFAGIGVQFLGVLVWANADSVGTVFTGLVIAGAGGWAALIGAIGWGVYLGLERQSDRRNGQAAAKASPPAAAPAPTAVGESDADPEAASAVAWPPESAPSRDALGPFDAESLTDEAPGNPLLQLLGAHPGLTVSQAAQTLGIAERELSKSAVGLLDRGLLAGGLAEGMRLTDRGAEILAGSHVDPVLAWVAANERVNATQAAEDLDKTETAVRRQLVALLDAGLVTGTLAQGFTLTERGRRHLPPESGSSTKGAAHE